METFGSTLRELRIARRLSQDALGQAASCDGSYVQRLEKGRRPPPSRIVVDSLAAALRLEGGIRDRFYAAAGYLPPSAEKLERWDGPLTTVIGLMTDSRIPILERDDYARTVDKLTIRWQAAGRQLGQLMEVGG